MKYKAMYEPTKEFYDLEGAISRYRASFEERRTNDIKAFDAIYEILKPVASMTDRIVIDDEGYGEWDSDTIINIIVSETPCVWESCNCVHTRVKYIIRLNGLWLYYANEQYCPEHEEHCDPPREDRVDESVIVAALDEALNPEPTQSAVQNLAEVICPGYKHE